MQVAQAVRGNPYKQPVARGYSMQAPVLGWNARDSQADMKEGFAITLDNFFPETEKVALRRGHESHATGFGDQVETLMPYHGLTTNKLFAAADGDIYDITSSGAIGAAVQSSLTSTRFQHVNFGTSAGEFLYLVNGADAPRYYDGSSWTTPTITGTGLTASDLIQVNIFKKRLFFIEKDTLSFWYFPVETIAGSITEFSLSAQAAKGGYLVAMGTWTIDAGDGIDDYAVFITSRGEAIVYQGTDPGDTNAWALVGVFDVGEPIGRRCIVEVGSELILITLDGYTNISRALATARASEASKLSDAIQGAVQRATRAYSANFGWQPIFYPKGNYVLFNVPEVEGTKSVQHVANTTTGAWCRFTNQNALCWAVYNDDLYFGTSTVVCKADTGTDDSGALIRGTATPAYSYLGARGSQKRATMVRPLLQTTGDVMPALATLVDFEDRNPTSLPTYSGSVGAKWDAEKWDVAKWGGAERLLRNWQSANGVGYAFTLKIEVALKDITLSWFATDWLYERGGYI